MLGASLHPRELSNPFEEDEADSLAEKRHQDSRMRTLGPMPAFPTQFEMKDEPVNGSQAPPFRRGYQRAMD